MNPLIDFALSNLDAFAAKYAGGDKVKALAYLGFPPAPPKETADAKHTPSSE